MSDFGQITLVGALGLAVYGVVASLLGVRLRRANLAASGEGAAYGVTALFSAAALTLLLGFFRHDYTLRYVYEHASNTMPMDLVLAAFYSGQQGSLLYWAWTLSIFVAVVLWQQRHPGSQRVFMPYVAAVLLSVEAFMALVLGFVSTPFERLPFTPPDGVGLNPLLYDEGMRLHPPFLLAGYMSWSVPFAFAIAALVTGRLGNDWVRLVRRYAMVAWLILGIGNVLGAWWAYRVLGWGGYWGWDPVENVALMPWLTGTAFIHSIQIQERRGMLKGWNVALVLVTFWLSVFGTFVVRSGVLASVHSFATSAIGPYFLTYLAVVVAGSLGLLLWRLPRLRAENQLDSLLSREASFLLNNLVFLGIAFAIFWGTIYPLVSELVAGTKISVGAPFFQQVVGPLLGAMLLLMGVAPLMPWRRASREHLLRSFLVPVTATLSGAVLLAAGGVRNAAALVGFALTLFVLATILQEFVRGVHARRHATQESYPAALVNLVRRNNRRYGGYVVHLGIVLIGAGVVASHAYQLESHSSLVAGQTMSIGAYSLRLQGLETYQVPGARVVEAPLVLGNEVLRPQKLFFQNFERQPSTRVAIRSTPLEDLYVVLASWEGSGSAARVGLAVYVNPLVSWVWTGALLFILGTFIALWPAPEPALRPATIRMQERAAGAPA